MSKSYSNSSLGNLDSSRMGLGQMGQGHGRVIGMMGMDLTSKMGPQRSHDMMSSGSSSQNMSDFRLGGRDSGPREPDVTSTLLASFGLSSSDLDALSRFPEDKITAENLPEIIQHLKRKRAEQAELVNRDRLSHDSVRPSGGNWDDQRSLRQGFDDRSSGLKSMGDFGQGGGPRDLYSRDRLGMDERERLRGDPFFNPSFNKPEGDFNRMGFNALQERAMLDKPRGMPSARNVDDFHGIPPKTFPHLCSLCDYPVHSFQAWEEHVSGRLHKQQCLLLLDLFPHWKAQAMAPNAFMLQQSTNPLPGIMGPPPMQMGMGGPGVLHGNIGGRPGMDGMQMQRPMQRKQQTGGRVVHVVDLEVTKNLKPHLLMLVEPFGAVTNTLILFSTKEAFIEMATPEQARATVSYYEMNPAFVNGNPVRVLLSMKYKEIKIKGENDGKNQQKVQGTKPQASASAAKPVEGVGRVIRLCNLPRSDYSDSAVVQLAKKYGKVVNYIIMRKMRQAFIEMEREEDARNMVEQCAKDTVIFKGMPIEVLISQKYAQLVLKIPNNSIPQQKKEGRKRPLTSEGAGANKKQKNERSAGDVVTTEEEVLTGSCDPEQEEDDDDSAAHLVPSDSDDDDAEVPDLDQRESPSGNESTLEKAEDIPVDKTSSNAIALTLEDLGPYQPSVPTGVNYVIEKTGYYCTLCSLFYTNEEMAKDTHCSSLAHYKKVKKFLIQQSKEEKREEKTEQ